MAPPLSARIQAHLRDTVGASAEVLEVAPLSGGACQELFRVEIAGLPAALGAPSDGPWRLALRADAALSLPGSVPRSVEFAVIGAAVRAGVPTPRARWFAEGLVREGAGAYFLDWVDGEAIGSRVVRHPRYAAARSRLPGQLARALACVHAVTPASDPDLPLGPPPLDPAQATLDGLRETLDQLPEPQPGLELAFAWLDRHRPEAGRVTLVHGDFRTGNFVVDPGGLVGVLDWEFTRWGDPMDDLGWLCMRDWRFGALALPAGGLATRADFYQAYADAAGVPVDPAAAHWWEIAANLRWGTGAVYQGLRYMMGRSGDIEMLAIPRRVAEMSWEALRLLDRGPPDLPRLHPSLGASHAESA